MSVMELQVLDIYIKGKPDLRQHGRFIFFLFLFSAGCRMDRKPLHGKLMQDQPFFQELLRGPAEPQFIRCNINRVLQMHLNLPQPPAAEQMPLDLVYGKYWAAEAIRRAQQKLKPGFCGQGDNKGNARQGKEEQNGKTFP